jgi:tetratricopeptide (TPR) repeat protein
MKNFGAKAGFAAGLIVLFAWTNASAAMTEPGQTLPAPQAVPASPQETSPAPAAATPVVVPPVAAVPPATAGAPIENITKKAADAEAPPSAAELAIVQNTESLEALAPPVKGTKGTGLRVTDILSQPADIRPLPEKYLIVKKDRDADAADARLTAGRVALLRGHYQAALEIFDELYKKNPADMRVAMGRAVAFQRLGQADDALAAYQAALVNDPGNVEALTNMLGLIKTQDPNTALVQLQQLRNQYPANADVTAQLGMVYGVAGDYENALKYLDMADALKPGNSIVLYNKAVVYDRMGKSLEAADIYRQIILLAGDGSLDQGFPIEAVKKRLAVLR